MRKNIILAGVGGQGVVLASKLIASCAMQKGERAHTAETIGMAQRGGSVFSHVRIGEGAYSPLIPYGAADLIIGFEPSEALRALPYLRAGGTVVVSSRAIAPTTATLSGAVFDTKQRIAALRIKAARALYFSPGAISGANFVRTA